MRNELQTFDGLDNRRDLMFLLQALGTDQARGQFITRVARQSKMADPNNPIWVSNCDPVSAYHMLIGCCNELGVSINHAAKLLENEVRKLL